MMHDRDYHKPVLLERSVEALVQDPNGIYVDATYGAGGHAQGILNKLSSKGSLIVFDQDDDAQENVIDDSRLTFFKSNFRYARWFLMWLGISKINGLIADLGVSSHQFDTPDRGFSHRFDADLDMRMNPHIEKTAADVINHYPEADLLKIMSRYGELRNAKTFVRHIVKARKAGGVIRTTSDLNALIQAVSIGDRHRYVSQVYQALRIEVNSEMDALEALLETCCDVMLKGGRLVVLSYHSLEDRMVKNFLKAGNAQGRIVKDEFGNVQKPFRMIGKIFYPSEEEMRDNSRSRSAKMRVGERI